MLVGGDSFVGGLMRGQAKTRLIVHWLTKLFFKLQAYIQYTHRVRLESLCFRQVTQLLYRDNLPFLKQ